jgi:hypothetical protein
MNVEIGTEALQLTEKEYINGSFLAVWGRGRPEGGFIYRWHEYTE